MDISKQLQILEKHLVDLINEKHEETSSVTRNDILSFKDEIITKLDKIDLESTVTRNY